MRPQTRRVAATAREGVSRLAPRGERRRLAVSIHQIGTGQAVEKACFTTALGTNSVDNLGVRGTNRARSCCVRPKPDWRGGAAALEATVDMKQLTRDMRDVNST